jgi:hypothetical protein
MVVERDGGRHQGSGAVKSVFGYSFAWRMRHLSVCRYGVLPYRAKPSLFIELRAIALMAVAPAFNADRSQFAEPTLGLTVSLLLNMSLGLRL